VNPVCTEERKKIDKSQNIKIYKKINEKKKKNKTKLRPKLQKKLRILISPKRRAY